MNIFQRKFTQRAQGFSLIELMIAMVLGVVVVGGCISIFSGVVRSSTLNQTVSNLQSNARFALDLIGRDIRSAGFLGCAAERDVALAINATSPPTSNLSQTAITGAVVGGTGWSPATPDGFTPPTAIGAPLVGTHALSVQYASFPGAPLRASMSGASDAIKLDGSLRSPVSVGELIVVSDCSAADLFKVSSVSGSAAERDIQPAQVLDKVYKISADYPDNTRAMRFVSTIYYVGDTQRTNENGDSVFSLFVQSYPYDNTNPPIELIEGVDQFLLEFGVRQADGSIRYVQPDSGSYTATGVETVRVGLLMTSIKRFSNIDINKTYTLSGQIVSPAGPTTTGASFPADRRMRMPFNATFNVRNRNL